MDELDIRLFQLTQSVVEMNIVPMQKRIEALELDKKQGVDILSRLNELEIKLDENKSMLKELERKLDELLHPEA